MLFLTLVSTISFYAILHYSHFTLISWVGYVWFSLLILTKIPLLPFSAWLPEAHVEASWSGSVVLAGYSLKFASIAMIQFFTTLILKMDLVIFITWFSFLFCSLAMMAVVDLKKLIANFSVVHMAATFAAFLLVINSEIFTNFSWHHHSIVTGAIFAMIGFAYAATGSRLLRWIFGNISLSIFCSVWFFLMTFSLDLPWTSNIFVEFTMVKNFHDVGILSAMAVSFWAVVSVLISQNSNRNSKLNQKNDIEIKLAFLLSISVLAIGGIGFVTETLGF